MILLSQITNNKDAKTAVANDLQELQKFVCSNTWSPSLFNQVRNNDNFISTSLLVLDIDEGATIEDAMEAFKGYKMVIAPTRSHMKEKNGITCHRFRLILFLSETVTNKDDFSATWRSAQQILPVIDAACKDVARQYYPSLYIAEVQDGATFPVIKGAKQVTKVTRLPEIKYPIPQYTREFMQHGALPGQWNATLYKATKLLQEAHYDQEEAIQILNTMTNDYFKGTLDQQDLKTIASVYATPGKYNPQISWPVMLQTKTGNYLPDPINHRNLEYFLTTVCGIKIKRNLLRNTIEFGDSVLDDYEFARLKIAAMDLGLKPSTELFETLIYKLANENSYHPFKDAVESIPWDGKDHITELYNQITIDGEEHPIYKEYLKRWFLGTIARVYTPTGQQNNMLVLYGGQGAGKSRFLEKFSIVPSMYSEGMIDPSNKDDILKTVTNIVFHLSELDSITRKKDAADLKHYLTATSADVRAPYDRFSKKLVPVCSFVASVNEKSFLVDPTGNRRFLVIPVKALNPNHNVNMQQVYAQALALYKRGEKFYFDRDEILEVNAINEEYTIATKMDYLLEGVESGDYEISCEDLLNRVGFKDNRTPSDYSALGRALLKLGIEKSRKIRNNKKLTYYYINKDSLPKKD